MLSNMQKIRMHFLQTMLKHMPNSAIWVLNLILQRLILPLNYLWGPFSSLEALNSIHFPKLLFQGFSIDDSKNPVPEKFVASKYSSGKVVILIPLPLPSFSCEKCHARHSCQEDLYMLNGLFCTFMICRLLKKTRIVFCSPVSFNNTSSSFLHLCEHLKLSSQINWRRKGKQKIK